jgi:hypothetical protein
MMYDTSVTENLEIGSNGMNHQWLDAFLSEPSPEAKAKGDEAAGSFLGTAPINMSLCDPYHLPPMRCAA